MLKDIHLRFVGFHASTGRCQIRLARLGRDKPLVIVCSQYKNYYGTSVTNALEIMSYCQELCMEDSRGVLFHSEPILEDHALHDLCEVMCGTQPMPPLGGTLIQFEYHRQHRDAGETAARLVRA
jgi:hypothetical protein